MNYIGGYVEIPSYIISSLLEKVQGLPKGTNTLTYNLPGAFNDLVKCANTKKLLVGEGKLVVESDEYNVVIYINSLALGNSYISISSILGSSPFNAEFTPEGNVTINRIEIGG